MPPKKSFWFGWLERLLGLLIFVTYLPMMFLLWMAVGLTAGEPILIHGDFITQGGSTVSVWRFRTKGSSVMIFGMPVFENISYFLRRYRLNDLPLIWNVVRGEVGLTELFQHSKHN